MDKLLERKLKFNEFLLIGVLLFTIFSGAVRKWLTINPLVINAIIAVQLPIIYSFILLKGKSLIKNSFLYLLFIYIAYLIIAASNPLSPSIYHSLVGFIIHLSFWLGIGIYLTKKEFIQTNRYLKILLIVIVAETILAFFQYNAPREDNLNQYAILDEFDEEAALSVAMVGESVRVAGTFSYISGFSSFVIFVQLFSFSLFFRPQFKVYFAFVGVGLSLVLALMTGSRATVFTNLILLGAFSLFQLSKENYKQLRNTIFVMVILLSFSTFLGDPFHIKSFLTNTYENFDHRLETNKEEGQGRISTPFNTFISNDFPNKIFGNGLGISYPAIVAARGTSAVAEKFWVQDDEMGRTLLEGGYILLFLKLFMMIQVIKNLAIDRRFMAITFPLVFLFMTLTTNIYNIVFFLIGIIYLDQAIISYKKSLRQ